MRRAGAVCGLVVVLVAVAGAAAVAQAEDYVCWTERIVDDDPQLPRRAVVCRVAGAVTIGFDHPVDAPVVLSPSVASDATGRCWYWTNRETRWTLIRIDGDRALLELNPDGGGPGPAVADAWVRTCDGEPDTGPTPIELVWEVIRSHDFPRPEPVMDPARGLAGLDTFVAIDPPEPVTVTVVSPVTGAVVEAELTVESLRVSWGDGAVSRLAPWLFAAATGAPDGALRHRFERSGIHAITADFDWTVRWRVDRGEWRLLPIAATSTAVSYAVDELVGRRTS